MKWLPLVLLAAGLSLGKLLAENEETEGWKTVFSVPPYQLDETVVGLEGWQLISSGKADRAVVQVFTHDASKTGLLLRTHGIQNTLETPLEGVVNVSVQLEISSALSGAEWSIVFMPGTGAGVGAAPFGFESKGMDDAGFFYTEKTFDEDTGRVILHRKYLLSGSDISSGAKYTLTATLDFSAFTYTLSVKGTDGTGQEVHAESDAVSMGVPQKPEPSNLSLTGLRIASNMPSRAEIFIESIHITPGD